MKKMYYGLNADGLWIYFFSKKPIRNCKEASEICKEEIIKFKPSTLFMQAYTVLFWNDKEYKRPI